MNGSDPSAAAWRKSTASQNTECAEVAFAAESVLLRHSQDPAGPVLEFTLAEWAAFLAGVRNGEFDGDGPAGRP